MYFKFVLWIVTLSVIPFCFKRRTSSNCVNMQIQSAESPPPEPRRCFSSFSEQSTALTSLVLLPPSAAAHFGSTSPSFFAAPRPVQVLRTLWCSRLCFACSLVLYFNFNFEFCSNTSGWFRLSGAPLLGEERVPLCTVVRLPFILLPVSHHPLWFCKLHLFFFFIL